MAERPMYYYACSYPLAPGSVIGKGNWGRMCRLESIATGCQHLLMEIVFEKVRLREFPNRPSRLNCNFLCPNLESLRKFVRQLNRGFDLLYKVELIDSEAERFETIWTLISSAHPNIAPIEEAAQKYWSAQKNVADDGKEVLVESDIKIVERLTL